ncbi:MAG: hypothetical protein IAE80_22955 [Anaerolinea sp.]|nr:hypothetical protein [Anaerolinea sp.]
MAYPPYLREKAIKLRTEQHLTLEEIVDCLQLPKTTIFYWIKDIPIPRTKKQTIDQQRKAQLIRDRAAAVRERWYQEGLAEAPALLQDPTFRDFVVLYMAEGYKRNRNAVSFVNSDAKMMALAYRWMLVFGERKFDFSFQYHADHDIEELQRYWGGVLGINPAIIKPMRKSNSNQLGTRKFRSVYGVLTVRTGDTRFRARLQGWMDYVKAQW